MSNYFGIDTSNYTTSAAVYNLDNGSFINSRMILDVENGEIGLRQSDAVFIHIKNLPDIIKNACENIDSISAIGVSDRPRPLADSYMPCFLAGVASAEGIAAALKIKLYKFSHQAGHIAAALVSSNRLDLIGQKFISFHVSGGTTEALLVEYDKECFFKAEIIGKSLDLKMGQAVDRIGSMLGLPFPAGKEMDRLSLNGSSIKNIKTSVFGCDASISGLQNKAEKMYKDGASREDVALFTIDFIRKTLEGMTENILLKYGNLPLVFAGGVMSNTIIRRSLTDKFGAIFASTELSSDNAVGIAAMTSFLHEGLR